MNQTAILDDRGVIRIGGAEARGFLQGLVTCDMDAVQAKSPAFGALLSPQGKILFDFHIQADNDGFLADCQAELVSELVKRLTFYKLRALVDIEDVSQSHRVLAAWGEPGPGPSELFSRDPRLAALGWRAIHLKDGHEPETSTLADYHMHRIALGVPEGGVDFRSGDTFPHEADMDQLNGVSFTKGCYVGQEVVSRMENRSTARTRAVLATSETDIPPAGTKIEAGGKTIGTLGSSAQGKAIVIVRIDRVEQARKDKNAFTANKVLLNLVTPEWASF